MTTTTNPAALYRAVNAAVRGLSVSCAGAPRGDEAGAVEVQLTKPNRGWTVHVRVGGHEIRAVTPIAASPAEQEQAAADLAARLRGIVAEMAKEAA